MLASLSKSSILISSPVSKFLMTNICSSCSRHDRWLISRGQGTAASAAALLAQQAASKQAPYSALQLHFILFSEGRPSQHNLHQLEQKQLSHWVLLHVGGRIRRCHPAQLALHRHFLLKSCPELMQLFTYCCSQLQVAGSDGVNSSARQHRCVERM
jgi:hypothetical protein